MSMTHSICPRRVVCVAALSTAFFSGGSLAAQTLIDSNPYVSGGNYGPYSAYCLTISPGVWWAQRLTIAFQTGSTAWNLSSVNLTLQMASGSSSGYKAEIFTSVTNDPEDYTNYKPASPLVTLNFPSLITSQAVYSFSPSTSTTLNANSTYWITLTPSLTPNSELYWLRSGGLRFNGSSMANTSPTFGAWNVGIGSPTPNFEVYGTAIIPEPSTYAAIAGLLAGAGAMVCRRRRRGTAAHTR